VIIHFSYRIHHVVPSSKEGVQLVHVDVPILLLLQDQVCLLHCGHVEYFLRIWVFCHLRGPDVLFYVILRGVIVTFRLDKFSSLLLGSFVIAYLFYLHGGHSVAPLDKDLRTIVILSILALRP
jgi:hypothetical protein